MEMIFEKNPLRVVIPLDPTEEARYIETVCDDNNDGELDYIYQLLVKNQDKVNPTMDGRLSWDRDNSCTLDSEEEVEQW